MSTVYHSAAMRAAVTDERRRLRVHQAAPGSERCAGCGRAAPCDDATAARAFLTERGVALAPEETHVRFRRLRRRP